MTSFRDLITLIEQNGSDDMFGSIPEIGMAVEYEGRPYYVKGYLKDAPRQIGVFGRRGSKLIACRRPEATWIIGHGVGQSTKAIPLSGAYQTNGRMKMTPAQHDQLVDASNQMIMAKFQIDRPKPTGA
ncbi:MAG: hypothetical protein EOP83_25215 [Verrucomicrobiaceae bacterium]|nr:MAG: hypothetical protein EOP83_25215 [Verrucomicrobiaceae bacterium]